MNNKSFYAVMSFTALVGLFTVGRDMQWLHSVVQILLCGGALYYIVNSYKRLRRVTWLMPIMLAVALVFNPIAAPDLSTPLWLLAYVVAMSLFYFLSRSTSVSETFIARKHDEDAEDVQ